MKSINEAHIVSCMANCETEKDLRDCKANLMKNDNVIGDYHHRKKIYNRIKNARSQEIRQAMLAPFEDEAKRMESGQKVYFGKRCESVALDWDFKAIKGSTKKIDAGNWCYVWKYQPKSKCLWLCRPGAKHERKNVINDSFSISDLKAYEISRAELKFRK